ncbi:MAG TPA: aldo/keto reductase [Abditibacteriaceae bacterium]|jgi:aryl-alcohol dehydrogenase-like predicted oxidoreductase
MQKRLLGRSGLEVSVLTMGCWQAGKSGWTNIEDDDTIAAMRAAFDAGINFFDTAEGYGSGYSERVLGKALEGIRDQVFIADKVDQSHLAKDLVRSACEESLKNLGTDRIDLYQIHWPAGSWGSPIVPIEETMTALEELRAEGKIRAIGVSNFNAQQVEEALQYGRIDSLQPPYSLFWRPFEENGTIQKCIDEGIGIIGYSPLAQGLLTGKFSKENRPGEGDNRSGNALFKGENYDNALAAVEQLKPIAERYNTTTGELSLAWLLAQPGVVSAITGARNAEQVKGNIGAANVQLSAEDIAAIDAIGRTVTDNLEEAKTNPWG